MIIINNKKVTDKTRISYVNGRYIRHSLAAVHIEDRGFQFSDGIYEVIALVNGRLLDENLHFERLKRSLDLLYIPLPASITSLHIIIKELGRRNNLKNGYVYIQITRGVAKRNHAFPTKQHIKPSLVITYNKSSPPSENEYKKGISVITTPDIRWKRCDIKSVSLLPNILAKQEAVKAKAKEAWMVDEKGIITEGSSSNCYIVDKSGYVRTYPESSDILGGVTRRVVLQLAKGHGVKVREKAFTVKESIAAKEAFATSTTMGIIAVTKINGKKVSDGKPGEITKKLMKLYEERTDFLTK